jgi:hypothetical protein
MTVGVSNEALGWRRVINTNIDGVFEATELAPGAPCRLQVTRQKFASQEAREGAVSRISRCWRRSGREQSARRW